MAKVSIEERAFSEPRLKKSSAQHRVSKAEILGYALWVWRASQQAGVSEASESDLLAWLDVDRYSKPEKALNWLLQADFLRLVDSRAGESWYKISGNEAAVERTQFRIELAKKAASIRYHREPKCSKHAQSTAPSTALSMPDACHTVKQINSILKPFNTPFLKLVPTARDKATALVSKAAAILARQANGEGNPESPESETAAFSDIERDLGADALKLFQEKYPRWLLFVRSWYSAYKLGKHDKFEARLVREMRATMKVTAAEAGKWCLVGDIPQTGSLDRA